MSSSTAQRVRELDGIRALAVISVMLNHLLVVNPVMVSATSGASNGANGLPHWMNVGLDHGWLGVDLFFVLSGFLITTILLGTKTIGVGRYFGRFYERRALRILPIYLIVIAALAVAYGPSKGYGYYGLCLAFAANYAPFFPNAYVPNGGGPLWSLAVEEQFYLLWPWLVLLLDRAKMTIALTAIVVVTPVLRAAHPDGAQFIWLRADGLASGALLALWFTSRYHNRKNDGRLAAALLAFGVGIFVASIPFGGLHGGEASSGVRISEALCAFAALVVFAVSRSGSPECAALRLPFLVFTGDLSYCLYLVHVSLIDAYQALIGRIAPQLSSQIGLLGANALRCLIVIAVAYAVATVSRRFVELPFLRLGRHERRPAPLSPNA